MELTVLSSQCWRSGCHFLLASVTSHEKATTTRAAFQRRYHASPRHRQAGSEHPPPASRRRWRRQSRGPAGSPSPPHAIVHLQRGGVPWRSPESPRPAGCARPGDARPRRPSLRACCYLRAGGDQAAADPRVITLASPGVPLAAAPASHAAVSPGLLRCTLGCLVRREETRVG